MRPVLASTFYFWRVRPDALWEATVQKPDTLGPQFFSVSSQGLYLSYKRHRLIQTIFNSFVATQELKSVRSWPSCPYDLICKKVLLLPYSMICFTNWLLPVYTIIHVKSNFLTICWESSASMGHNPHNLSPFYPKTIAYYI